MLPWSSVSHMADTRSDDAGDAAALTALAGAVRLRTAHIDSGVVAALLEIASLRRYLRARDQHVQKAADMLCETAEWRASFRPDAITADNVRGVVELGTTFISGKDRLGRPIVYMCPGARNPNSADDRIKFMACVVHDDVLAICAC
jgi:hypothetical protein